MPRTLLPLLVFPFALLASVSSFAEEHHHQSEPANVEGLGTVSFPISCPADAQRSFNRGVALLHSFSYTLATAQFKAIATEDPSCAMAYWGEAISQYRQLWERPGPGVLKQGIELMRKAQQAEVRTDREKGYVQAAAAFYTDDSHATFESRRTAYSDALAELHGHFPADNEASLFFALSLLTSPDADKDDAAIRRRAIAILNQVFAKEPNHPGAAHYIIHACDTPGLAKEGLAAARRYAQIAPASAHALHMPSHIFARLGLWDDDIRSNLASIAAAEKQNAVPDRLHAMNFLEYAYLQQGRFEDAKDVESRALAVRQQDFTDMPGMFNNVRVRFPSLYLLETKQWHEAESMPVPQDAEPDFQAVVYWTRSIGAGHLHDVAATEEAVKNYDSALEAVRKSSYSYVAESMKTTQDEAHAWLAFVKGDANQAVALLTSVAKEQDRRGKGEVELPAREMLADMLLALSRPQDALTQYQHSLDTDPNRFNGLIGAARSAEQAGQQPAAQRYYRSLLLGRETFTNAELTHARIYLDDVRLTTR